MFGAVGRFPGCDVIVLDLFQENCHFLSKFDMFFDLRVITSELRLLEKCGKVEKIGNLILLHENVLRFFPRVPLLML